MKSMDTSEWRFIEDDKRLFDPLKSKTSSTQQKERCFDVVDQTIEQEIRETTIEEIRNVVSIYSFQLRAVSNFFYLNKKLIA